MCNDMIIKCQNILVLWVAEFHSGEVVIISNTFRFTGLLWRLLAEEIQPGISHTQHEIDKIPL